MVVVDTNQFEVRLAVNEFEILAAQKLRYKVFVEEFGADVSSKNKTNGVETDKFDQYCQHLILIDKWSKKSSSSSHVVGTIRLLEYNKAEKYIGFYSAKEYNLNKVLASYDQPLEVSRTCVEKNYRRSIAIHFLWLGLAQYVLDRDIKLMFGVASFYAKEKSKVAEALTLLNGKYRAPACLEFRAKKTGYIDMNIIPSALLDHKKAMDQIPSLLKAYLRMGAQVGDGAFFDRKFKTIDVGILMTTELMDKKYREFYSRIGKQ